MKVIYINKEINYCGMQHGKEYYVLSIFFHSKKIIYLVSGGLYNFSWDDASNFEVLTNDIPSNWKFGFIGKGELRFAVLGFKEFFSDEKYYEKIMELEGDYHTAVNREIETSFQKIEQFDTVKLQAAYPSGYIPQNAIGLVTAKPDERNDLYEVTFYKEDGTEYDSVIVPRGYLELDSKA